MFSRLNINGLWLSLLIFIMSNLMPVQLAQSRLVTTAMSCGQHEARCEQPCCCLEWHVDVS